MMTTQQRKQLLRDYFTNASLLAEIKTLFCELVKNQARIDLIDVQLRTVSTLRKSAWRRRNKKLKANKKFRPLNG